MSKVKKAILKALDASLYLGPGSIYGSLASDIESVLKEEKLLSLGAGDESFREESNALMKQALGDSTNILCEGQAGSAQVAIVAQSLFFARLFFSNEG